MAYTMVLVSSLDLTGAQPSHYLFVLVARVCAQTQQERHRISQTNEPRSIGHVRVGWKESAEVKDVQPQEWVVSKRSAIEQD
jgi:hypothetical protein